MPFVVSEKLSKLLGARQAIQDLALEQLVEDFVQHLEEEYRYATIRHEIKKKVSITQWLGALGDYGAIVDRYRSSASLFRGTSALVNSIASFTTFAEALEKALNHKYPSGNAGYLLVRALHDDDDSEREVIVTFRYDPVHAWCD